MFPAGNTGLVFCISQIAAISPKKLECAKDDLMKSWQTLTVILGGFLVSGCSAEESAPGFEARMQEPTRNSRLLAKAAVPSAATVEFAGGSDLTPSVPAESGAEGSMQPGQDKLLVKPMLTKIIRTGDVQIIVDNFDAAYGKFKQDVDAIKGAYIAKAEISGSAGTPRRGTWKVRIPVTSFDSFMEQLAGLGVPERNVIDSRDVTEEYYDVEARLRNKKTEEARLVKHLETSTGKLEEILKVEHEISRVRGDIEQMEGRLRMIDNLATLTTVNVTMQEIKNYVPAQAPTFSTRITRTFGNSTDALVRFGELVVLAAVGLAPWLPLIAVVAILLYVGINISRRTLASKSPVKAEPGIPTAI
jgi:hypothetical protein